MKSVQRSVIAVLGAAFVMALPLRASAREHGHYFESRGNHAAIFHGAAVANRPVFNTSAYNHSSAFVAQPFRGAAVAPVPRPYAANWGPRRYAANYPLAASQYVPPARGYYPAAYSGAYAPSYGSYAPAYGYAPNYGSGYGAPVAAYPAGGYPGSYAYGGANCGSYKAERRTANLDHLMNERAILQQRMAQTSPGNAHRLHTQLEYVNRKLGNFSPNGCAAQSLGMTGGTPYNSYIANSGYNSYGNYNNGYGYGGSPMSSIAAPLLQGFIR